MKLQIITLAASAATLFLGLSASADVVALKNGDRLTGTVEKMEGKYLKFNTVYAGTVDILWEEVSHLDLDEPTDVMLDDRSIVEASRISSGDSTTGGSILGKQPAGDLDADDVNMIRPDAYDLGTAGQFEGRVNLAVKLEGGNSDSDEVDFDLDMSYRRGDHRFRSLGQLEYDRTSEVATKQDWFVLPKYDYFISERAYLSGWYGAKQEKFAGLELRQFAGPSIGYEFFQGSPTSLSSELGVFYFDEVYIEQPDNSFYGPGWFLKFEQDLYEGLTTFYHKHSVTVNAEDTGKILWHSWTGFRVPLFHHFIASLEYEIDYDGQPALKAKKSDNTFRLKLGYEW